MSVKKSKILTATCKPEKDKYGNYSYTIKLENNDSGYISSKEENKYKPNDLLEYTIELKKSEAGNEYGIIKDVNAPKVGGFKQTFKPNHAATALEAATEVVCSMVAAGYLEGKKSSELSTVITANADVFCKWLKAN